MYKTVREKQNDEKRQRIQDNLNNVRNALKAEEKKKKETDSIIIALNQKAKELEEKLMQGDNIALKATNAWCDITNALIRKYKLLSEEHPEYALEQLTRLEELLIKEGFLTEKDIKEHL